jgi:hypothetical protein
MPALLAASGFEMRDEAPSSASDSPPIGGAIPAELREWWEAGDSDIPADGGVRELREMGPARSDGDYGRLQAAA